MSYTAEGLVKYVKEVKCKKTAYMWGGLMRPITKPYITQLMSMYPSKYTNLRVSRLQMLTESDYFGCDCVGLIKSYYFGGIGSPYYIAGQDVNTGGMFSLAKVKGSIDKLPERPGLILYMDGHVGVYIGNGRCIECTLGNYGDGVVETAVAGRGWTNWMECPFISYKKESTEYYLYCIQPGDSFWSIAEKEMGNGTLYHTLAAYNDMLPNEIIHPNEYLKIPREVK